VGTSVLLLECYKERKSVILTLLLPTLRYFLLHSKLRTYLKMTENPSLEISLGIKRRTYLEAVERKVKMKLKWNPLELCYVDVRETEIACIRCSYEN